jgi:hypothetical protein
VEAPVQNYRDLLDNWTVQHKASARELYVSYLTTEQLADALELTMRKLKGQLSTRQREILLTVREDLASELKGRQLGLW